MTSDGEVVPRSQAWQGLMPVKITGNLGWGNKAANRMHMDGEYATRDHMRRVQIMCKQSHISCLSVDFTCKSPKSIFSLSLCSRKFDTVDISFAHALARSV